jgi:hypothetical protein
MPRYSFTATAILSAMLLCAGTTHVRAQQSDATSVFETAAAKAKAECASLWTDHAFDPFRDKLALGEATLP